MEKNELRIVSLLGAIACSFCFGLGQYHASGAPIPTCSLSCCEPFYAWDPGPDITGLMSAQAPGTKNPLLDKKANTTNALPGVYLPAPTLQGCNVVDSGTKYDRWIWPKCYYSCQNSDGTNPTPQQVSPYGTPTQDPLGTGLARMICAKPS